MVLPVFWYRLSWSWYCNRPWYWASECWEERHGKRIVSIVWYLFAGILTGLCVSCSASRWLIFCCMWWFASGYWLLSLSYSPYLRLVSHWLFCCFYCLTCLPVFLCLWRYRDLWRVANRLCWCSFSRLSSCYLSRVSLGRRRLFLRFGKWWVICFLLLRVSRDLFVSIRLALPCMRWRMNIGYYGFRQVYISSCLVSFTVIRSYVAARWL